MGNSEAKSRRVSETKKEENNKRRGKKCGRERTGANLGEAGEGGGVRERNHGKQDGDSVENETEPREELKTPAQKRKQKDKTMGK